MFVRAVAGDAEDDEFIALVPSVVAEARWESGPEIVVQEPLVVFDSAGQFARLEEDEFIRVDISPGRYRVRAAEEEWGDAAEMILVQLEPSRSCSLDSGEVLAGGDHGQMEEDD